MDATDRKIIDLLVENGRATHTEIGRAVGLSPHAIADRIRRLLASGVITGFTALVDLGSIGRGLEALVDVRLLSSTTPEQFERVAFGLPTVQSVAFLTGRFDYQVQVACDDADDLDHTVRTLRQRAGAAVTETRIVLRSRSAPTRIGR
jgi:Lrp/AsnC family transcriptional regulator, leucine-responsive regulatory protein